MTVRCLALLVALLLATPAMAQPRLDALGDPLPPGAVARLGTRRLHHGDLVRAVAFAPDGKSVVAATDSGLTFWDLAGGRRLRSLPHSWAESAIAFDLSPDGRLLAAASGADIVLWDVATAKEAGRLKGELKARYLSVMFTHGGKSIAAVDAHGSVRVADVASREWTAAFRVRSDWGDPPAGAGPRQFAAAALSPNGRSLAAVSLWHVPLHDPSSKVVSTKYVMEGLELFDLATGQPAATKRMADQIVFSPDAKRLAALVQSITLTSRAARVPPAVPAEITLHDAATGRLLAAVPLATAGGRLDNVYAVAFSPDGGTLALASDEAVGLWSLDDTTRIRELPVRPAGPVLASNAHALAFAPDGKTLAVGVGETVQLFDVATGTERVITVGHRGPVSFLTFSADGRRLSTGVCEDSPYPGEVLAWDTATWKQLGRTIFGKFAPRAPVVVSPDHRLAARQDDNQRLTFEDLATGKQLGRVGKAELAGHDGALTPLCFAPDGRLLLARSTRDGIQGMRHEFLVFEVPSGRMLAAWPAEVADRSDAVAFAPDGSSVAFFANDGTIWVMDLATGQRRWQLRGHGGYDGFHLRLAALAFSADGKRLLSWAANTADVRLWDLTSGRLTLEVPSGAGERASYVKTCLAWSQDGHCFAVAAEHKDHAIGLYEAATGKLRRVLTGHEAEVLALAFTPDGRYLVSGSTDSTVLVWDLLAGP
jgi:WD40 repeat protein